MTPAVIASLVLAVIGAFTACIGILLRLTWQAAAMMHTLDSACKRLTSLESHVDELRIRCAARRDECGGNGYCHDSVNRRASHRED